jgi:hypothetical protein
MRALEMELDNERHDDTVVDSAFAASRNFANENECAICIEYTHTHIETLKVPENFNLSDHAPDCSFLSTLQASSTVYDAVQGFYGDSIMKWHEKRAIFSDGNAFTACNCSRNIVRYLNERQILGCSGRINVSRERFLQTNDDLFENILGGVTRCSSWKYNVRLSRLPMKSGNQTGLHVLTDD